MAGFIRRFTTFPTLAQITSIESVDIVDLIPPGIFIGTTTGTVCLVGEWPKGPLNTPTLIDGSQVIKNTFGGMSLSMTNPLSFSLGTGLFTNPFSNGCSFVWLKGKSYRRLVLCRVDMTLVNGVKIQITGTPSPTTQEIVIPAGTRVRRGVAQNIEFALAFDVRFAAGINLATVAFTAFDVNRTSAYTTRTVSGVPVYSTRNQPEGVVGDVDSVDATDLFRAGIGAGTGLPSVVVATTTGALDGAAANGAVLTPLVTGTIDTRYVNAIAACEPGSEITDTIEIMAAARQSDTIRTTLQSHAANTSRVSRGRVSLIRPPIGTLPASAVGAGAPGVGATRSDRVIYCYPHYEQRIPELAELDPLGVISIQDVLIGPDSAMSTLLSELPPENNPGQSTQDVVSGGLLQFIRKMEDGLVTAGLPTRFDLTQYETFKAAGVAALRRDPDLAEWIIQSGVTSVSATLFPSQVPIKRRRMADYLQFNLALISKRYSKKPRTEDREDSLLGEMTTFLDGLLSENNPAAQRIESYALDATSGNTKELAGAGVFVEINEVRTLSSFDNIVLQTNIGESVEPSVRVLD